MRLGLQHLRRVGADNSPDLAKLVDGTGRLLTEIERLDRIARSFTRHGAPPDARRCRIDRPRTWWRRNTTSSRRFGDDGRLTMVGNAASPLPRQPWERCRSPRSARQRSRGGAASSSTVRPTTCCSRTAARVSSRRLKPDLEAVGRTPAAQPRSGNCRHWSRWQATVGGGAMGQGQGVATSAFVRGSQAVVSNFSTRRQRTSSEPVGADSRRALSGSAALEFVIWRSCFALLAMLAVVRGPIGSRVLAGAAGAA